jgi:hypothetical protein
MRGGLIDRDGSRLLILPLGSGGRQQVVAPCLAGRGGKAHPRALKAAFDPTRTLVNSTDSVVTSKMGCRSMELVSNALRPRCD